MGYVYRAVRVDHGEAPRRSLHTEDRADGHGWPECCLDGADLRVFCRRVHIEAIHLDRHAATPSRAHEGEASEALILNRGYGKLFGRPYALPQVMVADSHRPEHADSPIGMNQR